MRKPSSVIPDVDLGLQGRYYPRQLSLLPFILPVPLQPQSTPRSVNSNPGQDPAGDTAKGGAHPPAVMLVSFFNEIISYLKP